MKAKFAISTLGSGSVTFVRDESDKKYYGIQRAAGEHNLFYAIRNFLNARGFDVIKKRAHKDGHMLGDEFQPYIRTRKSSSDTPHIYIYSGFYALRGADEDWNAGEVCLQIEGGIFVRHIHTHETRQPDWWKRIFKIAEQHDDIECLLFGDALTETTGVLTACKTH